jgi:O-antigen/teichoic acid export membrane protein
MVKLRLPATTTLHRLFLSNKDALVCLFDQGIVSVAGFATSVLIGRWAGKAELGLYVIGLSMVLFARGFQQQLVSTPYTIYHHRRSDSLMPAYRGSCLVLQALFIAITLAYLVIQILAARAGWISAEVVPSLIVLLIFIPAILMRELVRNYCFVHSENTSVLKIDLAISTFQVLALFGFGFFGLLSGATAWIAIGVSCALTIGYWYYRSGPVLQFAKEPLAKDLKLNWTFAKWAVSGQFVGSLPTYLLPWLLLLAAGAEGTGLFGAGLTLVGVANIFNTGILNYLTPKAAKVYVDQGSTGLRRLMIRMYLVFLLAIGSFIVMLAVVGDWVTVSLFGSEYAGLQTVLTLLASAKLFEGFSHTASGGLFAMERIKANFWVDVILMVITITSALLLIHPYGVFGAAWTTLIAASTSAILRSVLLMTFLGWKSSVGGVDD